MSGNQSLMIASGDAHGRVVVWDVGSGEPVTVMSDAGASFGKDKLGIVGLTWVTSAQILAILLEHGKMVFWDSKSTLTCVKTVIRA